MILMIAPGPFQTFTGLPSGTVYTSDQFSLIKIVDNSAADQVALQNAGCFTASPFGGWGNFGFTSLAELYSADEGSLLPYIVGFPLYTVVTVFSDPVPANTGTWCKTSQGNGAGFWTQVSTQTLASIGATAANSAAVATTQATNAAASASAAAASATSASASADTATTKAAAASTSATAAATSAASALASAQASGATNIYASNALATAAASGLANGTIVQVIVDETRSNDWCIYKVASGALVFLLDVSMPTNALLTRMATQMISLGLVLAA